MESKNSIINYLDACGIGLARKSVSIVPWQPQWPNAFQRIKKCLTELLGAEGAYRIEHVGSTSVISLAAKPVLDVLVIFSGELVSSSIINLLAEFGFEYKGDGVSRVQQSEPDPRRHFFSFYNDRQDRDFVHLHVYPADHEDVKALLALRDALRADKQLLAEYQTLKMRLWQKGHIRSDYTLLKSEFIGKVISQEIS